MVLVYGWTQQCGLFFRFSWFGIGSQTAGMARKSSRENGKSQYEKEEKELVGRLKKDSAEKDNIRIA